MRAHHSPHSLTTAPLSPSLRSSTNLKSFPSSALPLSHTIDSMGQCLPRHAANQPPAEQEGQQPNHHQQQQGGEEEVANHEEEEGGESVAVAFDPLAIIQETPPEEQEGQQQNQQQDEVANGAEGEGEDGVAVAFNPPATSMEMARACFHGDVHTIGWLVDAGESVNGVTCNLTPEGYTPVLMAISTGQLAAVKVLVARGADPLRVSNKGANLLHLSSWGGNVECLKWTLAYTTIGVNSTTCGGNTPLHYALCEGHLEAAKFLVEKGADLFKKDLNGVRDIDQSIHYHPTFFLGPRVLQHARNLRWSSVKPLLLVAKFFISSYKLAVSSSPSSSNANANVVLPPQLNSLRLASKVFSNPDLVRRIASFFIDKTLILADPSLEQQLDQHPPSEQDGEQPNQEQQQEVANAEEGGEEGGVAVAVVLPVLATPRMIEACRSGDVRMIRRRILAGESVDGVDGVGAEGRNLLMVAIRRGELVAVEALVASWADLSRVDTWGRNLLHHASWGGNVECLKWTLAYTTIGVNSTAASGKTPLHYALSEGQLEAAKFLVEKGADLFVKNHAGLRVIDTPDHSNIFLGPQVLQHARNLRWSSVKPLLLVAKKSASSLAVSAYSASSSSNAVAFFPYQRKSLSLSSKVYGNDDLVRHIASFFIDKTLILADPTIKRSSAVKQRIEARQAAHATAAAAAAASSD